MAEVLRVVTGLLQGPEDQCRKRLAPSVRGTELRLTEVVRYQIEHGWMIAPFIGDWGNLHKWLLAIPMFISFVVFTIAIFAETNRLPFDLPEAETELVGGYHTEYGSMKFGLFFLGEYVAMKAGVGPRLLRVEIADTPKVISTDNTSATSSGEVRKAVQNDVGELHYLVAHSAVENVGALATPLFGLANA